MLTTLTIAGTPLDAADRDAAGICNLEFSWDLEAPWSLTFAVVRCGTDAPFVPGTPVTLATANDDGSDPVLRFVGDIQQPDCAPGELGVTWNYTCTDLKHRADYVTLTGLDGSGVASFNLSPDDPLNLYALDGQTVGDILKAILEQPTNAAALDGLGIGAYVTLSPPTLPPDTLADFALMTVVPPEPVRLSGSSILNTLEQFALRWHAPYCSYVLPDGTIRYRSIFALTPQAVTFPDDPIDWPAYSVDCSNCYTAWQVTGLDIQTVYLNTVDGTLWPGWTSGQQAAYTIRDFLQPKDASDDGDCTVTSSSATVTSDYARAHWPLNFWNGAAVGGWIYLSWPAGTGIDIYESRQITSCTALTAGGSATVTWDSGLPLNSTSYTRYRIVGLQSPLALVGRDFVPREPATGDLALDTFVGSHMYPRNPKGMPAANNTRAYVNFYPYAFVQWSRTGAYPWWEVPVNVQLNPKTGHIVLTEPAVSKSAALAGASSVLLDHYPASFQEGLYYNLQVTLPVNRGGLAARSPASGYSGTAYTQYGIERTFTQYLDSFTWIGDQPALEVLAAEHLATVRDAVVTGSIDWHELPTSFDCMVPGYCLQFTAPGSPTRLDGLDLPARSCTVRWCDPGDPHVYTASMRYSNLRRPFEGDSLYIHPALGQNTFGTQEGEVFGMPGGSMDIDSFNQMSVEAGQAFRESLPTNALSHESAGQAPVGETPAGEAPAGLTPAGQDAGSNPIADSLSGGNQSAPGFATDGSDVMEGFRPGQPNRTANREAARQPSFLGGQEQAQAVREQGARDKEANAPDPLNIMNMAPDPDKAGFGQKINPDAPDSAPKRNQRPRGPGLAARRGQSPDDDQDGGG